MDTLYNKLRDNLEEFLKEKQPKIEPSSSNTTPLFLLLTAKPDLVGFAALDGQPEENFSKAFQNFKDLYSIHSSDWADFDLTLVLCKTDTEKISDEFCNEIELDPYFCRKFVIDLSKELKIELGRLPFIPLRPEGIDGLKRPISAQTFLMKHGVKSDLAKYLVVPYARGIERIVKECVEEVLGEATWLKAEIEEFLLPPYEVVRPKVRLKELEISNFRAYRGNHKFDLDADLVVLYGPNGFGKTSFFDGIDFVCTGSVGRFEERFVRDTEGLTSVLKHLDSSKDNSFVKATVYMDGEEVSLERCMKDRTQAYIRDDLKNRKRVLMELAGLSEEPPDLRIDNLARLFRATHLFGQEYQSLTSGFRDHSKLSEDIVSRMLASQDYVEAINKITGVSEELKRQIKEKESEINLLRNSLVSKKFEMEQLSQSAKIVEEPETLSTMGKEIAEKIIHEVNIPIETPKEFNKEIVRDWRAKIAVQKSSVVQKLEVIEKLEALFPEFVTHRKKLQENLSELTLRKELLDEVSKKYSKEKKKLEEAIEKLKKRFLEERNLSSKKENFNWLLQAKVDYKQFKEQIAKEDKDYRNIQIKLLDLIPKIERLKSENKAAKETIGKITADMKILENSLQRFSDFEKTIPDWLKIVTRQKELKVYLQKIEQEFVSAKNELRIKKDELNTAIVTQDNLRKHLDNLQQSQSELRTLLDNIERHILNNICPVCGTSHKSREELMEKLKIQQGIQPKEIQEALKLFEDAKAKVDELKKYVSNLEFKIERLEQKFMEAQEELFNVEKQIKIHEEKAITLDIPIDSEDLVAVIDSKRKNVLEQMNIEQQDLFEQKSKVDKKQEGITILAKQQESLEQDFQTIESKLSQLQSMIDKISSDASTRQVSLELEKELIQSELSATNNIIEDLRKQIEIQQPENQTLQKEVGSLLEKRNILEREIQELDKEIFDSKKYIEEVKNLIKKLNLDIDIDQVKVLKKDLMGKLASLDSLQSEITNFEIALDAMQISAALAKVQQDIENIKKQFQNVEGEQDRLKKWLSYFDDVRKELESMQNQSLKEYTGKYGPLTSTIQRRLRSVYGFGGIRLHPEKGGIAVRVKRKGERNISPSDYFSESQIQIVMLSLFLSAALTQTWSSFRPILLDDPVEHFDDLNAYSLLDLIRGLITEHGKERQFIISTCEDRLFRLMRQKFSKLDGKVIFYVFESIGEKGPKVKRLENA